MSLRAVICDVYKTLLEVGPPPMEAAEDWERLWRRTFPATANPPTLADFAEDCRRVIDREHALARSRGIAHPEVYWPEVARTARPELGGLDQAALDDFLFRHAQFQRTVRLMPGAAEVLARFRSESVVLGIASNAQPYTLRELDRALAAADLSLACFDPGLCFWSFAAGFSKPDPHVFRWLAARLQGRSLAVTETLVVGDRVDNDMEPARAQGFATWHLVPAGPGAGARQGDWWQLLAAWPELHTSHQQTS